MRIIYLITGSLLISIANFLIIIYLNLFTIGYTFLDFAYFIIRSGIIIILLSGVAFILLGMERKRKNELLLWSSFKF